MCLWWQYNELKRRAQRAAPSSPDLSPSPPLSPDGELLQQSASLPQLPTRGRGSRSSLAAEARLRAELFPERAGRKRPKQRVIRAPPPALPLTRVSSWSTTIPMEGGGGGGSRTRPSPMMERGASPPSLVSECSSRGTAAAGMTKTTSMPAIVPRPPKQGMQATPGLPTPGAATRPGHYIRPMGVPRRALVRLPVRPPTTELEFYRRLLQLKPPSRELAPLRATGPWGH